MYARIAMSFLVLGLMAGTLAAAPPTVEGREFNPVAREYYETEKPLVEDGPVMIGKRKSGPEIRLESGVHSLCENLSRQLAVSFARR